MKWTDIKIMNPSSYLLLVGFVGISLLSYWVFRNPSKKWKLLTATIITFSEKKKMDSLYNDYPAIQFCYPEVKYFFHYNGNKYISNKVAHNLRDIYEQAEENVHPWSHWETGKEVQVFVNPMKPTESILLREMSEERNLNYKIKIMSGYASLLMLFIVFEYVF